MKQISNTLLLTAATGSGWAVSEGLPAASLLLPVMVAWQSSRCWAAVAAAAFSLAAAKDILGVQGYLDATQYPVPAWVLWAAAGTIPAAAWALTWRLRFATTLALAASAVPPLAIVSWAHPFHAAGVLFPALGVAGLLLTIVLLEVAVSEPSLTPPLLAFALIAASHPPAEIAAPQGWVAVDTHLGDVRERDPFEQLQAVVERTRLADAEVVIWPEGVIPRWSDATDAFFAPSFAATGKALVLGSTLAGDAGGYRNVALVRGRAAFTAIDQRIPVPVAMWNPIGDGVPLDWFAEQTRMIAGKKAAVLLCYEQLLVWPYLRLLFETPDVLVGLSNVYWVRQTSIPKAQAAAMRSWAQLLGVPHLEAINR